jgi:antitoxin component YwqK of YwqJK toxin-antitoxin module
MKKWIILCLVFVACKNKEVEKIVEIVPPKVEVLSSDSSLHNDNGTWMKGNSKFSGYIVSKDGERLIAKLPVINGKENGTGYEWYKNGKLKFERNFLNGDREGLHKGWYENGATSFIQFFKDDKLEGKQLGFFESGHRFQVLNYQNGYEDGKQKTWNDSGRVVNNFTVKNGKLYGIIGRYDCMSVMAKEQTKK